jgi:hypothetical protein
VLWGGWECVGRGPDKRADALLGSGGHTLIAAAALATLIAAATLATLIAATALARVISWTLVISAKPLRRTQTG